MSNKDTLQATSNYLLGITTFVLIITSIIDFGTWAEGINTYAMYFLIGIVMFYVLLKSNFNRSMIWNFILISGIYFVVEIFNIIYYPFFPATAFFPVYFSLFSISLAVSLIILRKESIKFDYRTSMASLIIFLVIIAVAIGYGVQWMA